MCDRISGSSTMSLSLGVILLLAFFSKVESHIGICVGYQCFVVRKDSADFSAANEVCKSTGGHLQAVRTNASSNAISTLLPGLTGDFWIGLHGICSSSASGLRGYKWITGQDEADFVNWASDDTACLASQQCVTVSSDNLKWRGRGCTDKPTGFICEYAFDMACQPLQPGTHTQIEMYKTPYDFEAPHLDSLPMGSLAKLSNGEKHVCVGDWINAPWGCEVLNGGCEHKCTSVNGQPTCTCPPGSLVDSNGWSCSVDAADPCEGAQCQHTCLPQSGTFVCLCDQGYALDADGKSCKDVDECVDKRICAGDHTRCENIVGSFACVCEQGFEMEKGICVDINECASAPCEHNICNNTEGSYTCSCADGYKISDEDPHMCELHCPQQVCPAVCDPNDTFMCFCPDGFVRDKGPNGEPLCVDIDECEFNLYCDQFCENSFGGYTCSCGEGYELKKGYECEPLYGPETPTSPTVDTTTTTSTITYRPTTESPKKVTAGALLGIIVCIVCALLAMVWLAHHCMKRRNEHSLLDARKSNDLHDLQQITTEHYKPSSSDIHSKGDR
ncbi:thrombomodulin [Engraulis encrasicolus]|uniref:thrombomodulin n=1 Tax=Engraulis encrasicolus TaxID=184585 RepID=UPI002FD34852